MKPLKKLHLNKETLHVLTGDDARTLNTALGSIDPTIIVKTATIIVDTIVQTITIITSGNSHVYSKCKVCPDGTWA
jgi:hypothetical protein